MRSNLIFRPFVLLIALFLMSCKKAGSYDKPPFENSPRLYDVIPGLIDEASGIADSYSSPGFLWVEEDSGNPPELHLLKQDGTYGKSIYLKGAINRDWEDLAIASGPDPAKKYIYLADIGDNNRVYSEYFIYRLPEPPSTADTVTNFEKISFKYPDGAHDAEAILVDEGTRDIYIITKRDDSSRIYRLAYPQSLS